MISNRSQLVSILIFGISLLNSIRMHGQTPIWDWAKSNGTAEFDDGGGIAYDGNGSIYVVGSIGNGTLTAAGKTITSNGSSDIVLLKYNTSGEVIWAKNVGGKYDELATDVVADTAGNIYVCGIFNSDSILLDKISLKNGKNANYRSYDIFIAKYDSSGKVLWAKSAGGVLDERTGKLAIDKNGNIFLNFNLDSDHVFWGTNDVERLGAYNAAIVKFRPNGNIVWAKRVGQGQITSTGIGTDNSGNVICTGIISGAASFGSFYVGNNCISSSCFGYFTVSMDSTGNENWANGAGGSGNGSVNGGSIATDVNGNVYATGTFWATNITFDTFKLVNSNLISNQIEDAFVVKYNKAGKVMWAKSASTASRDGGNHIYVNTKNEVYVTGKADGNSMKFDTLTTIGHFWGGFIAKLDTTGKVLWNKPVEGTGLEIEMDQKNSIYLGGTFKANSIKFDTITVNNTYSNSNDLFLSKICSAAPDNVDGKTAKSFSCSGIGPLFSINSVPGATSYLWRFPNGDTIVTKRNFLRKAFFDTSGLISITARNACGFSATYSGKFKFSPPPDVSVTVDNKTLTSVQNNALYQWYDCDADTVFNNEIKQSFTAVRSGKYSVIVSFNSCIDTSDCKQITINTQNKIHTMGGFESSIYPIPVHDILYLGTQKTLRVAVYNQLGECVLNEKNVNQLDLSNLKPGLYYLQSFDKDETIKTKIIKY